MDASLSSADIKCLLHQWREVNFATASFYEPWSQYIANQSGSAKVTVSPKIGENIELLVCFICMGTQGLLLYQLLIFLNLLIVYLFRQRDWKKNTFLPTVSSWLFFISSGQWIGNEQLFKCFIFEQKKKQWCFRVCSNSKCMCWLLTPNSLSIMISPLGKKMIFKTWLAVISTCLKTWWGRNSWMEKKHVWLLVKFFLKLLASFFKNLPVLEKIAVWFFRPKNCEYHMSKKVQNSLT